MEPGRKRQRNLIVNPIALVDMGRSGPNCAISDGVITKMIKDSETFLERGEEKNASNPLECLTRGVSSLEEKPENRITDFQEETDDEVSGSEENKQGDLKDEKPEQEKITVLDRRSLFKDAAALVEILAQGLRLPITLDTVITGGGAFFSSLDTCKRRALDAGILRHGGLMAGLIPNDTTDGMSRAAVDAAFLAASKIVRVHNNRTKSSVSTRNFGKDRSIEDIGKKNRAL